MAINTKMTLGQAIEASMDWTERHILSDEIGNFGRSWPLRACVIDRIQRVQARESAAATMGREVWNKLGPAERDQLAEAAYRAVVDQREGNL